MFLALLNTAILFAVTRRLNLVDGAGCEKLAKTTTRYLDQNQMLMEMHLVSFQGLEKLLRGRRVDVDLQSNVVVNLNIPYLFIIKSYKKYKIYRKTTTVALHTSKQTHAPDLLR